MRSTALFLVAYAVLLHLPEVSSAATFGRGEGALVGLQDTTSETRKDFSNNIAEELIALKNKQGEMLVTSVLSRFGNKEGMIKHLHVDPIRMYVNGEPAYGNIGTYDVALVTSGSNLHENAVYVPFYMMGCNNGTHHPDEYGDARWHTMARDRPIDVLYRSSNCDANREAAVNELRKRVEAAGLRFEHSGKCSGGSSKPRLVPTKGREWHSCAECFQSKMMISMSRPLRPAWHALDEKLLTPNLFGAVPIYLGTGEQLAQSIGWNSSWWLNMDNFTMPSNSTIDSLRTPFPCYSVCNNVRAYMSERKLRIQKPDVIVRAQKGARATKRGSFWQKLVQCAFGDDKNVIFTDDRSVAADVTLDQCCW